MIASFRTRPCGDRRTPALLLVCLLVGISPGALGAVIEVDTLDDVVDAGDAACSLREAIDNANDDAATHADCEAGAGEDTIRFAQTQALYDAAAGGQHLELAGDELTINDAGDVAGEALTVEGLIIDPSSTDDPPAEVRVTIDGGGNIESDASACVTEDSRVGRVFTVQTPTALSGFSLANTCIQDLDGGIVFNASALTLSDVSISNGNVIGTGETGGRGGGIFNAAGATLIIDQASQVSGSFASRYGGGIANLSAAAIAGGCPLTIEPECTIALASVTLSSNLAGFNDTGDGGSGTLLLGSGGGLYNDGGMVAAQSVTVSSNLATVNGGGIWNSGTVTLLSATVQSNQAQALTLTLEDQDPRGGGAIFNEGGDLNLRFATLSGNSVTHNDILQSIVFPAVYGGAVASTGGDLDLDTVAMTQNQAGQAEVTDNSNEVLQPLIPGLGGALYVDAGNLTIADSTLFNNVAQTRGGGIWHGGDGLDMQRTTVQNNQAHGEDADGTTATGGGGLYNDGPATIVGGRFYGNVADGNNGSGGGILNAAVPLEITDTEIGRNFAAFGGGIDNSGTLTLTRVSLGGGQIESRNIAGDDGGGLHNRGGGDATVDDSSVVFNSATHGAGVWNVGTLTVANSTFSDNQVLNDGSAGDLYHDGGGTTLRFTTLAGGGVTVAGGAEITAASSLVTGHVSGNIAADGASLIRPDKPGLETLKLYGGVTLTRPLTADSGAVDHGDGAACGAAPIDNLDQRGAARPPAGNGNGTACDSGAFERTGDPVLTVEQNGPLQVSAELGGDLVVLAFSISNNGGESVTVGGFDVRQLFNGGVEALRRLVGNDPDGLDQLQFDVVLDDGVDVNAGNGLLDEDETTVVGSGDESGRQFQFDGGAGRVFPAGASEDFLVVLYLPGSQSQTAGLFSAPPIFAGGLLIGLLGLVRLRGVRRRVQWLLVVALLTVGLAACSQSTTIDDLEPPPPPVPDPSLQGQLRFKMYRLTPDAAGGMAGEILIGDGLPVYGPAISVP